MLVFQAICVDAINNYYYKMGKFSTEGTACNSD